MTPSKFAILTNLFGEAVGTILRSFLELDDEALTELLADYGEMYGDSAEKYARKTFPAWKSGTTKLSGQTMERLVELVPPYLSAAQRFAILQLVLARHRKSGATRVLRINVKEPAPGFAELLSILDAMSHDDVLAHLPERVMQAASWLYDDDVTACRAMLAEAERVENDMIRAKAEREIALLRKTISTGQVKSAAYTVEMPAGALRVVAYSPSLCFVASVCFGEAAAETAVLRWWRDEYLVQSRVGIDFIVWYYRHGEGIAKFASRHSAFRAVAKTMIAALVWAIERTHHRGTK